MVYFYNENEKNLIEDNIKHIVTKARIYSINYKLEPTLAEYKKVHNILLDFIAKNNRVVYGGYAWNKLITQKNPEDAFYHKDLIEFPDIEFYSFEPIKDSIKLCDLFYENNFKHVQFEEASHHETYSLFVNNHNYADVSYMPKILYNKLKYRIIDNIRLSDPNFIYIDIYRMLNDPITSYWRIEKSLKRAHILMKHYPLNIKSKFVRRNIDKSTEIILNFVRQQIIENSELLVFGYYAYEYFLYKGTNEKKKLYVPYYDVISTNLENDAQLIFKKLQEYDKNIKVEEYHKFFQFLDKSVTFKFNGKVILNIYGANELCIPYIKIDKKKINVVTYPYMIQMFLIKSLYHNVFNNIEESLNLNHLLLELIKIRNKYLKSNKKTILDETPFQEFRIDCLGDTIDSMRKNRLKIKENIEKGLPSKLRYVPAESNDRKKNKLLEYNYDNSSGNLNSSNRRMFT